MPYSKKNLCHFGDSGEGAFQELPVFNVLRASCSLFRRFSGNLTACVQVVFQVKNLKRFSDIKLSLRNSSWLPLYARRTFSVGFVTFFEPVCAAREWIWPG
jgi:hypothetical protein